MHVCLYYTVCIGWCHRYVTRNVYNSLIIKWTTIYATLLYTVLLLLAYLTTYVYIYSQMYSNPIKNPVTTLEPHETKPIGQQFSVIINFQPPQRNSERYNKGTDRWASCMRFSLLSALCVRIIALHCLYICRQIFVFAIRDIKIA